MLKRYCPRIQGFAIIAAMLVCASSVGAEEARTPLRTGLWEQTHAQTLNGIDFVPPPLLIDQLRNWGIAMSPSGRSEKLCLTRQSFSEATKPYNPALPACRRDKVALGPKGISGAMVCKDGTGAGKGSANVVFDDSRHYHGSFEFTGTHELLGGDFFPMHVEGQVQGRWLADDCRSLAGGAYANAGRGGQ